jgi:hypothetical protein
MVTTTLFVPLPFQIVVCGERFLCNFMDISCLFFVRRSEPSSCCCLNVSYEPISEAPRSCCLTTLYSQLHGHFCACLFCFEILVGIMSFNCSCIILAPIWLFNQVFDHTLSTMLECGRGLKVQPATIIFVINCNGVAIIPPP